MAIKDYDALATTIIDLVGGADNINGHRHCATRLRLRLKDEGLAQTDQIKALDGVVTVAQGGGEYMVVIGNEVPGVYDAVARQLGGAAATEAEPERQKGIMGIMNLVLSVVMPAMDLLCAGGILKGILTLLAMFGIIPMESGLYVVLNAVGDAIFYFLPAVIGYNYAQYMGVNGFVGFVLGAALCYPDITGQELTLFGMTNTSTYSSTFLPVLLICAVAIPIFKFLSARLPKSVSGFAAPAITFAIAMPLGVAFIGPAANYLGFLINGVISKVMTTVPLLGGIVFGGLFQVLVVFGIHQAVLSVSFVNVLSGNPDPLMAISFTMSFAQIGAVLAIMLKTKDQRLKEVALPSFISGIFGITEPAIYGVTLPRIKTFVCACIGGAVLGGIMMLGNCYMYNFTGLGVFALLGIMNPENPSLVMPIIALAAGFATAFILTWLIYRDDDVVEDKGGEDAAAVKPEAIAIVAEKGAICAPVDGKVELVESIPDAAFASEAMGKTVAIWPVGGDVFAPVSGTVVSMMPHAFGIAGDDGCEVLVHVGIDTVSMNGDGFTLWAKQGDHVSAGDPILTFDRSKVAAAGYKDIVMTIVTNSDDFAGLSKTSDAEVAAGAQVMLAK